MDEEERVPGYLTFIFRKRKNIHYSKLMGEKVIIDKYFKSLTASLRTYNDHEINLVLNKIIIAMNARTITRYKLRLMLLSIKKRMEKIQDSVLGANHRKNFYRIQRLCETLQIDYED